MGYMPRWNDQKHSEENYYLEISMNTFIVNYSLHEFGSSLLENQRRN